MFNDKIYVFNFQIFNYVRSYENVNNQNFKNVIFIKEKKTVSILEKYPEYSILNTLFEILLKSAFF